MFKYTCLNPIARLGLDLMTDAFVETDKYEEANAVLVRSAKMHDMELGEELLAIARAGAGVNNIPVEECAKKGIVVFNTPGANANAVKELVIAGMLLASRDIIGGVNWVDTQEGNENVGAAAEKQKKQYAGEEIYGKKLGVIGLGAIGARVANAASGLGMKVLGYDPYISVDTAWNLSSTVEHIKDINEIFKNCDFITVHVPLTADTKNTIDDKAIELMKDGVVILNFSRDGLVNEDALLKGLENGKIKKYVTDFATPGVIGNEDTIVIPHLGASTKEAEDNCAVMAVNQLVNYIENGNIKNSVNFPNCDLGVCEVAGRVGIFHKNITNMIGQFTAILAEAGINIEKMTNQSKGDFAYTLIDTAATVTDDLKAKIAAVDGVIKVRVVK
ncbi:D-3-phosphoglycerate dehydrogenase [Acetitomaculum ruminis DSM 5522]|uniref:D-3-phosphoglycerate dehydrogenase n=1 Tax=Acetitomaculum ruminis DSM 5522 TaxID=1120918 RepID=A0A1I0VKH1_9FIRM|nr:phosphoglycerate dehydrogenase [Acetitomaculum ruminis]SFA76999.1 D-3-phosphoglycerate dehydrogenase [Acetitomaculum ruminis DSM 5522]